MLANASDDEEAEDSTRSERRASSPSVLMDSQQIVESADHYRVLFTAIDVGFCVIEILFDPRGEPYDYRFLETNPAFERQSGLVNAIGKTALELVPNLNDFWFRAYGDVALTGNPARFENHAPAMSRWFDVYALRVGLPENGTVGVVFTDITARKQSQEALRQSEEQLQKAQARLEAALTASDIATWTIDLVNDCVTGDAYLAYLFSVDPEAAAAGTEPLKTYFDAIHEEDRAFAIQATTDAMRNGTPYAVVLRVVLRDGSLRWISSRGKIVSDASGTPLYLIGAVVDITDQKLAEERERARLIGIFEGAPAFMAALRGSDHVFEMANPPYYQLVGHRDIIGKRVVEALPEVVGQRFIGLLDQVYQTGEAFIGNDFPILLQVTPDGPLEERFLDFTYQPLRNEDGSVSGILAHGIDLTARKRLEQERERLLDEARTRAAHAALLNQIGTAVRSTLEPDAILQATVAILGQGLEVDRCYFVRYNQTRDTARVFPEWIRDGLTVHPLAGRSLQMSTFAVDRDTAYKKGNTHVVDDVVAFAPGDSATLTAVDIRSLLRVPIEVGEQMTALAVSMAFDPRHWTDEEVRLVENVATLLHSVLESALSQQRERNIAQQLQEALQPATPDGLPGLALASYYRPALAEAGVGGDFFDVFPIENGCNALVVADLSGKGLAAASQVSTVRNMLRCVLYEDMTIADAVTGLHRKLVKHELLTGFATLFVGAYDDRESTFTYVNCGQDAALIFRGHTGNVEQLRATGPVLGGFGDGDFEEKVVHLFEGDVIAIFTDGLTEVGPTRKTLLEIEGVSDFFRACCIELAGAMGIVSDPQTVVKGLIARVDDFARGGTRDDIALLVGVVGISASNGT